MGWESRGGRGCYYTRSVRCGGRVVRQYCGTGERGEEAAELDRRSRAERDAQREKVRAAFGRAADVDARVHALYDATDAAVRAALLSAGYHQHNRGAWRRRRAWRD